MAVFICLHSIYPSIFFSRDVASDIFMTEKHFLSKATRQAFLFQKKQNFKMNMVKVLRLIFCELKGLCYSSTCRIVFYCSVTLVGVLLDNRILYGKDHFIILIKQTRKLACNKIFLPTYSCSTYHMASYPVFLSKTEVKKGKKKERKEERKKEEKRNLNN